MAGAECMKKQIAGHEVREQLGPDHLGSCQTLDGLRLWLWMRWGTLIGFWAERTKSCFKRIILAGVWRDQDFGEGMLTKWNYCPQPSKIVWLITSGGEMVRSGQNLDLGYFKDWVMKICESLLCGVVFTWLESGEYMVCMRKITDDLRILAWVNGIWLFSITEIWRREKPGWG